MIKIKIHNPTKGRNEPTFRALYLMQHILRDHFSIDITDSDDYDYMFIGFEDFYDINLSLKDSADWGVNNVEKISQGGDYFLFDGFDSTSLAGTYEVLNQSNAIYLFKNQLLKNKEDYKNTAGFGRWWFPTNTELDISYDISEKNWNRIKLSGMNLASQHPDYYQHVPICTNKSGVNAIFLTDHPCAPANGVKSPGLYYMEHRKGVWKELDMLKNISVTKDRLPKQQYVKQLWKSQLVISPYGMGEICYRDFEAMQIGTC